MIHGPYNVKSRWTLCDPRIESWTFRIEDIITQYAIHVGCLPVGVLSVQLCQSVTTSVVVIISIYPHARYGIGCLYFCFSKLQNVGKLAFAVIVTSLTSPHSVVPLLSRIRTSVNTRQQCGDWWCVRILAGDDGLGVNTGANWPRVRMR